MAVTINGTTGITTPANTVTGNESVGGNLTVSGTGSVNVTGTVVMGSSFKRNRIINGNMLIDQRNAGASITPTSSNVYTVDRWYEGQSQASKFSVQQNAGAVTPPAGFTNYLGVTSLSAYSLTSTDFFDIRQAIEGPNAGDLAFGTANAKSVTLSFYVYSSLTGTFGGVLRNYGGTRFYPFSYTISAANTWTAISVTIAGDTSGTWTTTAGNGWGIVVLSFGAGTTYQGTAGAWSGTTYTSCTSQTNVVGTNGATFYITGVQLEVGSSATPYEMQIYSDQLAQCQRYYVQLNAATNFTSWGTGLINAANAAQGCVVRLPVSMRTTPTTTYSNVRLYCPAGQAAAISSITSSYNGLESLGFDCSFSTSVMTTGQPATIQANNTTSAYIAASAEL